MRFLLMSSMNNDMLRTTIKLDVVTAFFVLYSAMNLLEQGIQVYIGAYMCRHAVRSFSAGRQHPVASSQNLNVPCMP